MLIGTKLAILVLSSANALHWRYNFDFLAITLLLDSLLIGGTSDLEILHDLIFDTDAVFA